MAEFLTGYVFGGYVEGDTDDYKEFGVSDDDAIKLASIGLTAGYLRALQSEHTPPTLFDNIGTPTPFYADIPSPKRSKRKITVGRLLNG